MDVSKELLIERVSAYLKQRFLAAEVSFDPTTGFSELGIDSMTVVELVMFIEEEFGFVIPADQLTGFNLNSLDTLADCAMQNKAGK
jgi:acyl carrier protein